MGDWQDSEITIKGWITVGFTFALLVFVGFIQKERMTVYAGPVEEEHFPSAPFVPPVEGNDTLPSINDDGAGSVYLRLCGRPDHRVDVDKAMIDLMAGKKWWVDNHPEKRVVSISVVHDAYHGHTCVVGLLMAYEDK